MKTLLTIWGILLMDLGLTQELNDVERDSKNVEIHEASWCSKFMVGGRVFRLSQPRILITRGESFIPELGQMDFFVVDGLGVASVGKNLIINNQIYEGTNVGDVIIVDKNNSVTRQGNLISGGALPPALEKKISGEDFHVDDEFLGFKIISKDHLGFSLSMQPASEKDGFFSVGLTPFKIWDGKLYMLGKEVGKVTENETITISRKLGRVSLGKTK